MESTSNDSRSALRVLVVEDDEDTATSYAILMGLYGYEVEVAADGPSALRAVEIKQPDVVLLDIALPRMTGWQVARRIRQLNLARRPLLIAITGYGRPADRLCSWEAGIDLHLLKPVDMIDLHNLLRQFQEVIRGEVIFDFQPSPSTCVDFRFLRWGNGQDEGALPPCLAGLHVG